MEWLGNNCYDSIDSIGKIITDCVVGKLNEQNILTSIFKPCC